MDSSELEGGKWVKGQRGMKGERDDRGVNKQCTVCVCVCVSRGHVRCVVSCWHRGRPAGVVRSSRPISSLTDCPDLLHGALTRDYNMTAIISPHYPPQCVMINFIIAGEK